MRETWRVRVAGVALILLWFLFALPVEGQLTESCTVSALNRTTPVQPDGTWVLPNVPANQGPVRVRATCVENGVSRSGQSDFFTVPSNGVIEVAEILFGTPEPIPLSLFLTAPVTTLTEVGQTVQLTTTATFSDGSTVDLTAGSQGTSYRSSNPAIATVDGIGLITAQASGRVLISALNEGSLAVLQLQIVASGDTDGDGLPDDWELANGLDPNNSVDAVDDQDEDGLSTFDEFQAGLNPVDPDSDDDQLLDGREVNETGTNPLLFDTDGDGLSDGLEVQLGSDPLDPNDYNLAGALASISIAPASFALVFNTVLGEASLRLTVTGRLIDGNSIDITSRGTNYASSNLAICSFGAQPGRVFAGANGACTITATNSGFSAQANGVISTFSPVRLSQITLPGAAQGVDVSGEFAYVASGAAGLVVVDVSNRAAPAIVATADTPGTARDVQVVGDVAYVADGAAGLHLFDVTNPATPVLLGALDTPGDARDVEVRGALAYVADGNQGLRIINVANPAAPALVGAIGALGTLGTFNGVDVDAEAGIAVAAAGSVLRSIDVSVPSAPVLLGTASIGGNAQAVALRDGYAHVADLSRSLTAVNLTDPARPVVGASTPAATGGLLNDVVRVGDLLFGSDIFFVNGVPIINVGAPASPTPTAILNFSAFGDDNGTGVAADGQFVYLTTDRSRLMIGQYLSIQDVQGVPPTVTITEPTADQTPLAGTQLAVAAEAADDVAVQRVDFLVDGEPAFTDFTRPYEFTMQVSPGTSQITLGARAVDFGNNAGVAEGVTLTVLPDEQAPAIGAVTPAAGTALTSGDAVLLSATVSDNVAVSAVTFRFGSRTYVDAAAPYEVTVSAPPVFAATDLLLRVEAVDPSGNVAAVEHTLPVAPVADTAAPQATFLSPGDGDGVVPGTDVTVSLQIVDDHFIDAYTLTLDGEVLASRSLIEQPTFTDQLVLTIPADAVAGQTFTLRLETSDFGGNTGVTQSTMVVISADQVLTGNQNLGSSFNGQPLVLGTGTFTVIAPLSLQSLTLLTGARVVGVTGQTLSLSIAEDLHVNVGASIDVSGLGFGPNQSYPGATLPGSESAGSHLGHGGGTGSSLSSTFGSIYRPQEAGGGGESSGSGIRGGGVVRISARNVTLGGATSAIRANGVTTGNNNCCHRGGAGGSVWITATGIGGDGVIEARGGDGTDNRGSGGGGAIAVEYGASTGTVLGNLRTLGGAAGSTSSRRGGAGTVYLFGPTATYGDLAVDNGTVAGVSTDLPAFGSGTAQTGSAGAVLETGRASVPAYFAGHWLEVRSAAGLLKGTWRIAAITNGRLTLAADVDDVAPAVAPGDLFQGVYRFDNVKMKGTMPVVSGDPIRVAGTQEIAGQIEVRAITADALVLRSGAVLTHPTTSNPSSPESLRIELSGDLVIESGASIDVSERGFGANQSYPGATLPGSESAGSHLGHGGGTGSALSSTFGSVYRPQEAGGGGESSGSGIRGGGVVRISARNVTLAGATSAIRANGVTTGNNNCCHRGGAGGSVWITATGIGGDGIIEARGGDGTDNRGSGGGGAIAVEYGASTGAVLGNLRTFGGAAGSTSSRRGGAGTVYLFGGAATYGDLVVDNGTVAGVSTDLPAFGSGTAQTSSAGAILETGRPSVPAYFAGHWLEVRSAGGALKGTWRVVAISGGRLTLAADVGGALPDVAPGDLFQGVYRFDNVKVRGTVPLVSADPIRVAGTQEIAGQIEVRAITADALVLRSGAVLTHPTTLSPSSPESLRIELSGDLVIESGASIDVSGRGFGPNQSYPGATLPGSESAGSHLGHGGGTGSSLSSTFGSIYQPQEAGGGGESSGSGIRGGGVVRISARNVTLAGATSAIRANGVTTGNNNCCHRGGAGGSVWITAAGIGGDGVIEARGGDGTDNRGSGGGGAIAVEYDASTGTVLSNLRTFGGAAGSTSSRRGGAGTVYLFGSAATYGDLVVNNSTVAGVSTDLPAFGSGTAQMGSADAVLETGRPSVPAYFAGHWLEVRSAAGALKGTWRVAAITGGRLTLAADVDGTAPAVAPGDLFQGVYRFDNVTVRGTVPLVSGDPIRVAGIQEIAGQIEMRAITADALVLRSGAVLTHPTTSNPSSPESLRIELSGDLVIEPGASIDVSGLGFGPNQSYPGATLPGNESAGSHLGHGGGTGSSLSSTFGSVYRPQESGGGGESSGSGIRGGGVVRISARNVTLAGATSAIRANGVTTGNNNCCHRGGAGGSVWISAAGIGGDGVIEARGGDGTDNRGSGGGGAIAVEYDASTGTVLSNLRTFGGAAGSTSSRRGGAGTVYLFGSAATYGDLVVDNSTVAGVSTDLPAFGSGTAQAGSAGAVLETGRSSVPAYFAGHWLEVRSAGGALKGTWRVVAIAGGRLTLAADVGGALPDVAPGDLFQGVYRFDNVTVRGTVPLVSADPIRVAGTQEIAGQIELRAITADGLVLRSGAVLTHPTTLNPSSPESLRIDLSGDLVIEPGASIDVSGRGFGANQSYPGATLPGSESAGSHLGHGGSTGSALSSTFGSVYRPQEAGGGGESSGSGIRGGGVVRISARNVTLTGATSAIRANGMTTGNNNCCHRGGAGGSVWITATGIGGDGVIETRGGDGTDNRSSGGGGAIAVEYGASTGAVLGNLRTFGGAAGSTSSRRGGAGTVYLFGPTATYGDLVVDNNGVTGQTAELPALGGGIARTGSTGNLLVTDRTTNIPAYFVGHWLRLSSPDGTPKGVYRVTAVNGLTAALAAADGTPVDVVVGDLWQGLYRFDSVTVRGAAALASVDPVESATSAGAGSALEAASSQEVPIENREIPWIDPSAIAITRGDVPGTWHIEVPPTAVVDPDGIAEIRLAGARSWTSAKLSPQTGAAFTWLGPAGEPLELIAIDAHPLLQLGAHVRLEPLPETGSLVATEALPRDEPQPRLASGNGYLLAAYTDRLVVADPTTQEAWTVRFADGETLIDLKVNDAEAVLTLRCATATGQLETGKEKICSLEVPLTDNLWEVRRWSEGGGR